MLGINLQLSPGQFDTLLSLYFNWREEQDQHKWFKKNPYRPLKRKDGWDTRFIETYKVLLRQNLVEHGEPDKTGENFKITEKGRKICEAIILEIEEWSKHIRKLKNLGHKKVG